MKRNFEVAFPENEVNGYVPGDEAAHRAAAALADRADAPTIAAFADALAFLERIGGQFHVVALRRAVGEEFETVGLGFRYETRDARVQIAEPPEEVFGVAVTDSGAPAVVVAQETDEPGTSDSSTSDEAAAERTEDPPTAEEIRDAIEDEVALATE